MDPEHRGHGVVLSDEDRERIVEALDDEEDDELIEHLLTAW